MLINEYFNTDEFKCKCGCDEVIVNQKLVKALTDVREYFKKPVIITSGFRCEGHNNKVGGSKKSKHILGAAADFKVKDVHADEIADYLLEKYPDTYGIGRYKVRTHLDVRMQKARWDKRK